MALNDMFGGARTTDGESASEAITVGDWMLVVQGTMDGASVNLTGNVFDSEFDHIDGGLIMNNTGFRVFRFCDGNVKATVSNAGPSTSVKVGIVPAV